MPPFIRWGRWARKGGDIAYATMEALQLLGVPTVLNVVGCSPPNATAFTNPGLLIRPFLDMGQEADRKCLYELFSTADFFILPSRAECAAIAFCDANAFGLPVFTTDVGGISSFVRHGVNGYMLSASASGEDFAKEIKAVLDDPVCYQRLRQQSRAEYETRLNWDTWAQRLLAAIVEKRKSLKPRPKASRQGKASRP